MAEPRRRRDVDDSPPLADLLARLSLWVLLGWLAVAVAGALLLLALQAAGVEW